RAILEHLRGGDRRTDPEERRRVLACTLHDRAVEPGITAPGITAHRLRIDTHAEPNTARQIRRAFLRRARDRARRVSVGRITPGDCDSPSQPAPHMKSIC